MDHALVLSCLRHTPLSAGIDDVSLSQLLACLRPHFRSYAQGAVLVASGDEIHEIGVVVSGKVVVSHGDWWGNRTILMQLGAGELFAESYACVPRSVVLVDVVAMVESSVLWIPVDAILGSCRQACVHHALLMRNLVGILAEKNIAHTRRSLVISHRTTREKLLAFLSACARNADSGSFDLPFDRQQLADYLTVDRSALSTVMGTLKSEGIIECSGRHVTLLASE